VKILKAVRLYQKTVILSLEDLLRYKLCLWLRNGRCEKIYGKNL